MARRALIITISITAIAVSSPTAGRAQGPFTVQLSDSTEALIVPDTIKLRDFAFLGRFDEPGTFREAVTRSIQRAVEESGPDLDIEGVIFHTFRIRELDGAHRELRFPIGDYATMEVRKT